MANLYELTAEFKEAEHLYNTSETEDEMLEAERYLIKAEVDLSEKAENIAKWIKNLEAERDSFKKESDRLAAKAKSFDNKVISLKRYLQENLELAGVDKVKGELFTVSLQNNAMSLDISTTEHIPAEFKRTPEPVVNKRDLLKYIKDTGEVFEGVDVNQTRSIRIR
ncbi:siphovirus Gp157 family protein [Jeotgalibaca porci]|uniref:siphovirus Gp157 family protein n=1 Tax=Jeotgalibaca porci TaxID=1868793 RepID=UPI0035A08FAF